MKMKDSQEGAVLLYLVLVVGLAAVAMMSALATSGYNSFFDSDEQVRSVTVRNHLMGCVDELLIQLNEDADVAPVSVQTLDVVCPVAFVNEGGDNRSADVTLVEENISRSIHIEMTVNGVTVSQFTEE